MPDGNYWDWANETRPRDEHGAEVLSLLQQQLGYVYDQRKP